MTGGHHEADIEQGIGEVPAVPDRPLHGRTMTPDGLTDHLLPL